MRKLKLQMAFSPGPWNDDLDKFCLDNLENVDCILLGRKTAEGFIPHWSGVVNNPNDSNYTDSDRRLGKPLTDIPKLVFSHTIEKNNWPNTTIIKGHLQETVKRLKEQEGKDIIVYGGYSFVQSLMKHGLIDEYYILLQPGNAVAADEQSILNQLQNISQFGVCNSKEFAGGTRLLCYKPQ